MTKLNNIQKVIARNNNEFHNLDLIKDFENVNIVEFGNALIISRLTCTDKTISFPEGVDVVIINSFLMDSFFSSSNITIRDSVIINSTFISDNVTITGSNVSKTEITSDLLTADNCKFEYMLFNSDENKLRGTQIVNARVNYKIDIKESIVKNIDLKDSNAMNICSKSLIVK